MFLNPPDIKAVVLEYCIDDDQRVKPALTFLINCSRISGFYGVANVGDHCCIDLQRSRIRDIYGTSFTLTNPSSLSVSDSIIDNINGYGFIITVTTAI